MVKVFFLIYDWHIFYFDLLLYLPLKTFNSVIPV